MAVATGILPGYRRKVQFFEGAMGHLKTVFLKRSSLPLEILVKFPEYFLADDPSKD